MYFPEIYWIVSASLLKKYFLLLYFFFEFAIYSPRVEFLAIVVTLLSQMSWKWRWNSSKYLSQDNLMIHNKQPLCNSYISLIAIQLFQVLLVYLYKYLNCFSNFNWVFDFFPIWHPVLSLKESSIFAGLKNWLIDLANGRFPKTPSLNDCSSHSKREFWEIYHLVYQSTNQTSNLTMGRTEHSS